MRPIHYQSLLLSCTLALSACVTQGYPGPELSPEQISTVAYPAPFISRLLPSWTVQYNIKIDELTLDRFNSITLLPGQHSAYAEHHFSNEQLIGGSESCYFSSDTKWKDKEGIEHCSRETSCSGHYNVKQWESVCSMSFTTKAGRMYELSINKEEMFMLHDLSDPQRDQSRQCGSTSYRYHDTHKTIVSTGGC